MKKQINLNQRYQIDSLLKAKTPKSKIAEIIGVSKKTIYNELKRNSKVTLKGNIYYPEFAEKLCRKRHKMKNKAIKLTADVKRRICWLIKCLWSPEQIVDVCKKRGIKMVSIESIYLYLYDLKRKGTDLCINLRRHHRKRRKRKNSKHSRQIIKNKVHISKRPNAANKASRIGHMEIDLMKCTNGFLLTITDRKSLYNIIRKIPNKSSQTIVDCLAKLQNYIAIFKTITSDNGTEFAKHKISSKLMNVKWYFADPYSSWQRGCNENQNGLIRQFASRKTDLNKITNEQILQWQKILNYRPRKKLNFNKPIEIFKNKKVNFIN